MFSVPPVMVTPPVKLFEPLSESRPPPLSDRLFPKPEGPLAIEPLMVSPSPRRSW